MGQDAEGNTEGAEKDDDYDVYETYNGDDEKNDTTKVPPFWFVVKNSIRCSRKVLEIYQFFDEVT